MSSDGSVTLSEVEYEELLQAYRELAALEGAGVDSWEGYGNAMRSLYQGDDD